MHVKNLGADEVTLVANCDEKFVVGSGQQIKIPAKNIVKKQFCLVLSSASFNCKEPCGASYFVETTVTPDGEPTAALGFGRESVSTTNDDEKSRQDAQGKETVSEITYSGYSSPAGGADAKVELVVSKTAVGSTEALLVLSEKFNQETAPAQVNAQEYRGGDGDRGRRGGWHGGGWGRHGGRRCRRYCDRRYPPRCWWRCW
mmetsp:Transcript_20879/g.67690  ORF Transcript_20879/g.67690 Transcript_20879/m.67690 type:complete len:201 (-) Transcript_20879:165-767(-)